MGTLYQLYVYLPVGCTPVHERNCLFTSNSKTVIKMKIIDKTKRDSTLDDTQLKTIFKTGFQNTERIISLESIIKKNIVP